MKKNSYEATVTCEGLSDPAELDAESWHLKITKTKPDVFLQV